MRNLNQLILKFDYEENFKDQDFYLSKSNEYSFKLLNSWPKWQKNFINLIGEKFSGKTHLANIFIEKFKGIKINSSEINNQFLKEIKLYENIVVEDLDSEVDENLFFTLLNIIDQDNKYLIITTTKPIVDIQFALKDLNSRSKNFLLSNIEKPEDDLMFALISTEELEEAGQMMVKQLKNRYNDPTMNRKFVIGVDRARMKLYDIEQAAQTLVNQKLDEEGEKYVERYSKEKTPEEKYKDFQF